MRFVLTLALALGASSVALAHDPPAVMQFVAMTPSNVLLTSNRGLIFGDPANRTWSLLCNEGVGVRGVSSTEPYAVVLTTSGRMLVATANGLSVSDDRGCSFSDVPGFANATTRGLIEHPSNPQQLYVIKQSSESNQIMSSADGGETWTPAFTGMPSEYPQSLLIAPSEPTRLYASIWQLSANVDAHFVLRSSDGAKTWERTTVELDESEEDVTLLAINPVDANELFARATGVNPGDGERLLHSRDGGLTFSSPITIKNLKSVAFSPDGAIAYASGVEGLYRATGAERTFSLVAGTARITAVRSTATELYVAGFYQGLDTLRDGTVVDGIGLSPAGGSSFDTWMSFREIQSQVSCPATSTAITKCARLWTDWKNEHPPLSDLGASVGDAGANDAGPSRGPTASDAGSLSADAGSEEPSIDVEVTQGSSPATGKPKRPGRGCSIAGGQTRDLATLALGFSLLALAFRRRRVARAPRRNGH